MVGAASGARISREGRRSLRAALLTRHSTSKTSIAEALATASRRLHRSRTRQTCACPVLEKCALGSCRGDRPTHHTVEMMLRNPRTTKNAIREFEVKKWLRAARIGLPAAHLFRSPTTLGNHARFAPRNATLLISISRLVGGGGGGIRTRDTVSRIHTFQACAFDRSATPPIAPHSRRAPRISSPPLAVQVV